MTKKKTILLHSRTGLSALAVGLTLMRDTPERLFGELLRLWPQICKPGQFISLETSEQRIVCFNSGATSQIVQTVFDTSIALWGLEHLEAKLVPENPLGALRARLLTLFPAQRWLLNYELTIGSARELWK